MYKTLLNHREKGRRAIRGCCNDFQPSTQKISKEHGEKIKCGSRIQMTSNVHIDGPSGHTVLFCSPQYIPQSALSGSSQCSTETFSAAKSR